jgi:hypothetical protein
VIVSNHGNSCAGAGGAAESGRLSAGSWSGRRLNRMPPSSVADDLLNA